MFHMVASRVPRLSAAERRHRARMARKTMLSLCGLPSIDCTVIQGMVLSMAARLSMVRSFCAGRSSYSFTLGYVDHSVLYLNPVQSIQGWDRWLKWEEMCHRASPHLNAPPGDIEKRMAEMLRRAFQALVRAWNKQFPDMPACLYVILEPRIYQMKVTMKK